MRIISILFLTLILGLVGCASNGSNKQSVSDEIIKQSTTQIKENIESKHPVSYIILAKKMFGEGDKTEAVKWYYIGQIRYKAYLKANPDLAPSGEPALFSSLMQVVGTPLNEYIGADVDEWVAVIDGATEWHNDNPDTFLGKKEHADIYAGVLQGLTGLKEHLVKNKKSIQKQRESNGLNNR